MKRATDSLIDIDLHNFVANFVLNFDLNVVGVRCLI